MDMAQDLEQRVKDMLACDKLTGEHKDATPLDYVRWSIEEFEANEANQKLNQQGGHP